MAIIGYPEFFFEDGKEFDPAILKNKEHIPQPEYDSFRAQCPRACHDVLLHCNDGKEEGILLVIRDNEPAKGQLWCLGGGWPKGVRLEESVTKITKRESGLDIDGDFYHIGGAPVYWKPREGIRSGAHELGECFYAKARGEIKLDSLHKDARIVTPEAYNNTVRQGLHPYMRYFMDKAIPLVEASRK